MSEDKTAQEIVIIRRRSHDEDEHGSHGLWKIAYADFMTALMAFFLVMWLVNAANKKTLAQVATYFNPMRMSDQVTSEKGLNNLAGQDKPSEGELNKRSKPQKAGSETPEELKSELKNSDTDERGIFRDPYGLLSELSKNAATFRRGEDSVSTGGSKNTASDVYSGGEGYRDPFDPNFRQDPATTDELPSDLPVADGSASQKDSDKERYLQQNAPPAVMEEAPATVAEATVPQSKPAPVAPPAVAGAKPQQIAKAEAKSTPPVNAAAAKEAEKEVAELRKQVQAMVAEAKTRVPNIEVTNTDEGVLVSLMDDARFGMFAVGSAKPRPELVAVMERIGQMLKDKPGEIVIRGHTDGRPYRSKDYDNWRLSSARAHMAYHMLVRGGVDEKRVDRIEGHADRSLRTPADANAAENRRIEILVKPVM